QWGLLLQPQLLHYGGLSGVLHAGVSIVAIHLVWRGAPRERRIGVAILGVLLAKVIVEAPWAGPLRHPPGWDIAVAPLAHATGIGPAGLRARPIFGAECACICVRLQFTSASRMVVFSYLSPFVVALGMPFIARSERLSALQLGGLVAAFAGVAWAFAEGFTRPA